MQTNPSSNQAVSASGGNSFFLPSTPTEWGLYKELREAECWSDYRSYLESLWRVWYENADPHFRDECQKSRIKFNQRFWEVYLGCSLVEKGHAINSANEGPDICIEKNERKIWIEAVAKEKGEVGNPNSVPEIHAEKLEYCPDTGKPCPIKGPGILLPEGAIILRYLSAIKDKYYTYKQSGKRTGILVYMAKRIVSKNAPVVIAVNSANIEHESLDGLLPLIVRSFFGLGNQQFHSFLDPQTNEVKTDGTSYSRGVAVKRVVIKTGQTETLDPAIFLRPTYRYLSAVIFSYVSLLHTPFKGDLFVIHNPFAKNKLDVGELGIGTEFWLEDCVYDAQGTAIIEAVLCEKPFLPT
jgi:hypothetical protein